MVGATRLELATSTTPSCNRRPFSRRFIFGVAAVLQFNLRCCLRQAGRLLMKNRRKRVFAFLDKKYYCFSP